MAQMSGMLDSQMLPGEEVLFTTKLHWITFLFPIIMFIVAFVAYAYHPILQDLAYFIFLFAIATGIITLLNYMFSEFAVTTRRVICQRGIIFRRSIAILLRQIETVDVQYNIIGSILNYGTVIIVGTGGTRDGFPNISKPRRFRHAVQEALTMEKS